MTALCSFDMFQEIVISPLVFSGSLPTASAFTFVLAKCFSPISQSLSIAIHSALKTKTVDPKEWCE